MRISLVVACTTLLLAARTHAIEVAGELFVDIDASTFTTGDNLWTNAGSYTNFETVGNPIGGLIETTPAVLFNGSTDAFVGQDLAPDGLVGFDPTRTIEAWVFNPSIASEETIVSWGKRGGPDGTNMAFNYGNHGKFGAVGHWGGDFPDLGWIDNGPNDAEDPGDWTPGAPDANLWHHLVYTFDEEFARVYSDGVLWNQEDMTQYGGLETHADTPIAIASQWEGNGLDLTGPLKGSMAIGRMRIHDGVLSDEQIKMNYDEEKASFVNPAPPQPPVAKPIPAGPIHRYSFNNEAGSAGGATITDSVGGADGVVMGDPDDSSFNGTQLSLVGGGSDVAPYVDLPNGLISGLTDMTVESWVTIEGIQNWSRIWDFGSSDPGGEDGEVEDVGDTNGGGTAGLDYIFLSASRAENSIQHRVELRNEDPAGGGATTIDFDDDRDLPKEALYTVVYDSDGADLTGGPMVEVYLDGMLVASGSTDIELGDINDVNNWLGRSNWTNDANFEGSYDEFRIYNYALNQDEVLGNFQAGPNAINIGVTGDIEGDGDCDVDDIDAIAVAIRGGQTDAKFDLNMDGSVSDSDPVFLITGLKNTWLGDSNLDGEFSSGDFVSVFTAGLYNTGQPATWATGDWNGDGFFDSGDFVAAFTEGGFEMGPRQASASVPEPATFSLLALGAAAVVFQRRRRSS